MDSNSLLIGIGIGVLAGAALGLLFSQLRRRAQMAEFRAELTRLNTLLEQEQKSAEEKIALLEKASVEMKDAFKLLSGDALRSNNASFLELAKEVLSKQQAEAKGEFEKQRAESKGEFDRQQAEAKGLLEKQQTESKGELEKREQAVANLVKPISESLEKVNKQIESMEKDRLEAFAGLTAQLKGMSGVQDRLHSETAKLVQALRKPSVRGQWGEMQLRRVVEMAGMLERCDFDEQVSVSGDEGTLRPDMLINLPGGKQVVVDAKTPLAAYLDALDSEDETERLDNLKRHAAQTKDHITKLSRKNYWSQFDSTPEFVVMFLPSESIFYAALEQDPGLIEQGVTQKVILATPTTLIALLRTVAYGWQQEALAENARRISDLGRELYERIGVMAGHFAAVGKHLDHSVESYNKAVNSLESRLLVSARKLNELGISADKSLPELGPVERVSRELAAPELKHDADSA